MSKTYLHEKDEDNTILELAMHEFCPKKPGTLSPVFPSQTASKLPSARVIVAIALVDGSMRWPRRCGGCLSLVRAGASKWVAAIPSMHMIGIELVTILHLRRRLGRIAAGAIHLLWIQLMFFCCHNESL